MPSVTPPTIVIPGITASDLHDQYELPPEAVWSTVRKKNYERITLHPKDQRYELVEPARVMSGGPFPLVYENLVEELRDELSDKQDGKAPVFPFGYDWRLPLDRIEEVLASFVLEVIDRTMLLPHYRDDDDYAGNPTVNLVGHSMGGMLIAGYIERHGGALVNKVVTLATPFQGSLEAVLKLTTGTADLGDEPGNARERHMARMTPALYHLLPSFEGNLIVDLGLEADIFEPEAWQPPQFRLRSHERRNEWGSEDGDRRNTGDGTVPLAGAVAPFLGEEGLVCVVPGDFGYWELRDRTLSRFAGFHGLIPKMNMLHRLVARFLLGADDPHGNTWGRRLPWVEEWTPPLALREKEGPGE